MNMNILLPVILAAVGLAGLLGAVAWGALRQSKRAQAEVVKSIQRDLRALCSAAVTLGDRVNRLEQQVRALASYQEELGMRQDRMAQSRGPSYEQAIKMVHKGASVEDLVELCGLARGEAELITMMHRYRH